MKISPMFNRKYTEISPPQIYIFVFLGYGHGSPRDTFVLLGGVVGRSWRFLEVWGSCKTLFGLVNQKFVCFFCVCFFLLSQNGKKSEQGASFLQQRGNESGNGGVNREGAFRILGAIWLE